MSTSYYRKRNRGEDALPELIKIQEPSPPDERSHFEKGMAWWTAHGMRKEPAPACGLPHNLSETGEVKRR